MRIYPEEIYNNNRLGQSKNAQNMLDEMERRSEDTIIYGELYYRMQSSQQSIRGWVLNQRNGLTDADMYMLRRRRLYNDITWKDKIQLWWTIIIKNLVNK